MGVQIAGDTPEVEHNAEQVKKVKERRATKMVLNPEEIIEQLKQKVKVKVFKTVLRWWQKASIKYAFSHPHVRSRLEKLMGSNLVSLTDREYMQKLQERILEEYAESMQKRIKTRESEEMERVKNLVLSGKIPLRDAPESMAEHPVMIIENYCNKLIAERRAKIKIPKTQIPTHLYYDDTPDPPSGLSIENGHVFRKPNEKLCLPVSRFVTEADLRDYDDEEEMMGEDDLLDAPLDPYMYTKEEYDRLKYESPLIKQLKQCLTVEEMYALADEIIGEIQAIENTRVNVDTISIMTGISTMVSEAPAPSEATDVEGKEEVKEEGKEPDSISVLIEE